MTRVNRDMRDTTAEASYLTLFSVVSHMSHWSTTTHNVGPFLWSFPPLSSSRFLSPFLSLQGFTLPDSPVHSRATRLPILDACSFNLTTNERYELSPVRLPLAVVALPYLANRASHKRSRKRHALSGLLSLILPDQIARCRICSTPPILIDSDDLSGSRATHRVSSYDERTSYVPCL